MKTKQMIGLAGLAILGALLLAPVSPIFAGIYLVGMLTSPIWGKKMSIGILGENLPPLTDEQKKAALLAEIKAMIADGVKTLKDKVDAIETKSGELAGLQAKLVALEAKEIALKDNADFKTLAAEHADVAAQLKALKEQGISKKGKKVSFEALTHEALKENKEKILASMKAEKPFDLVIKYPETITEDSTIYEGSTFQSLTQDTGIFSGIRRRITKYIQNVSTGTIATANALWFEEVAADGKPYFIHEKETKAKEGFKIVEKTERVKKIAVRAKMSMEWMEDLPQFVSFLKNKLMKSMDIEMETKLFSGAGGTGSDEPLGILVNAVAFTGGTLANKVKDANAADVIRAVALQVEEAFGIANAIFCQPGILAQIDTIKTDDGLYTRPYWANGELVAGLKVITTMAVGADVFVGGDLTVMNLLFRNSMTIRIGETGDDFQENKKSILLEQRLVQFISANDYAQIVKGTFTNAKAILDPQVSS
jgi:hypothetical protein